MTSESGLCSATLYQRGMKQRKFQLLNLLIFFGKLEYTRFLKKSQMYCLNWQSSSEILNRPLILIYNILKNDVSYPRFWLLWKIQYAIYLYSSLKTACSPNVQGSQLVSSSDHQLL